jgi:membrane protein implicated in regulation of membrane protease activity
MENKALRFMMILWSGIGIACVILSIYSLIINDLEHAAFFGIITAIAAIMFFLRRYQYTNKQKRDMSTTRKKNS